MDLQFHIGDLLLLQFYLVFNLGSSHHFLLRYEQLHSHFGMVRISILKVLTFFDFEFCIHVYLFYHVKKKLPVVVPGAGGAVNVHPVLPETFVELVPA